VALIINNECGFNGLQLLDEWSQDCESYDKSKVEIFIKILNQKKMD